MKVITCLVIAAFLSCPAFSQTEPDHLRQWQDNKFSMFIHFGVYSELGGVWRGKNVDYGYSEQIQSHAQMFSDDYAKTADRFNPANWNADSIAALAKRAGMRSIVITSKHHDGFCMFKTATTDYNIVDATPFKRDVIKELSDACKRQGLNFGLYYSVIDWHYPQAYPISSHNADFITPEHHEFSKKQLRELLANYGPISELWFDMGSQTLKQSSELRAVVKELQPNCMISGRIGNDQGDFCVMGDNEYPDYSIATPWQVPASMFDETWGYRSWQRLVPEDQKVKEKLLGFIKTVSRGGNYLLNIGPKGDGGVTDFERNVLTKMGKWINMNAEAIYGTKPMDLEHNYGELTTKGNKLYVHFYEPAPTNPPTVVKQLFFNGLASKITRAYPLNAPGQSLQVQQRGEISSVTLPDNFLGNDVIRVVVVECEGNVASIRKENESKLPQYSFSGIDYYGSYRSVVRYTWSLKKIGPATITYTDEEKGREFIIAANGKNMPVSFTDGKQVSLPKQSLTWGDVFILGEREGLIGTYHREPLGSFNKMSEWNNTRLFEKPAGFAGNWYWRQEITATAPTKVIVQLPLNDGVSVYLNDKELFTINNPSRDPLKMTTLLLPLTAGTNHVLVKYFNRFGKKVNMGILNTVPQVVYQKPLPKIDAAREVSIQLPPSYPIHQNVDTPNVEIRSN